MLKEIIPQDIKAYSKKEILKSTALCLALIAFEGILFFIFANSLLARLNHISRVLFCLLLIIIPIITSGLIGKLCDRSWEGVILDVHKKTTLGNTSVFSRGGAYKMFVVDATMKMDNGKIDIKTVYEGPAEESQMWLYKEGTVVRHIKGCKYLQIISTDEEEKDKKVTCVVCGREEEKSGVSVCKRCGHTLIR